MSTTNSPPMANTTTITNTTNTTTATNTVTVTNSTLPPGSNATDTSATTPAPHRTRLMAHVVPLAPQQQPPLLRPEWSPNWVAPDLRGEYHGTAGVQLDNSSNNGTAANDGPKIIVRTEEILIVSLVLILWIGAIVLFFNRWGKIRMLEPYQPKFQHQQHRSSCPLVDIESLSPINSGGVVAGVGGLGHQRASFSRMSMGCSLQIPPASHFGSMSGAGAYSSSLYAVRATPLMSRTRQNSVFAGQHCSIIQPPQSTRKTRSAMDLSSMVLDEAAESV